jgi:hypothetical protein
VIKKRKPDSVEGEEQEKSRFGDDELSSDVRAMIRQNTKERFMLATGFAIDPFTTLMIVSANGFLWWALFSSYPIPNGLEFLLVVFAMTAPFVTMYAAGMRMMLTKARTTADRFVFICQTAVQLLSTILSFALIYRIRGLVDVDRTTNDPLTCLYFSIVTWTTLGYGDVRPSLDARMFAAVEALTGYIAMATLIALFAIFVRRVFLDNVINSEGELYKDP